MRDVPIGIQDFKRIRDSGAYYVDKSPLIDHILRNRSTAAFLFTRPRRFGKSVNLSMLDAYFNIRYSENHWFDGLRVSELRPNDPEKNSRPVIYIDLKDLLYDTFDNFVEGVQYKMATLYEGYPELLGSSKLMPSEKKRLETIMMMEASPAKLSTSVRDLSQMLEKHYGTRCVVLIDEYDDPVNNAYGKRHQREILDFIRNMMSSALKGNPSLELAVITGVLQIAKESIFSGLNNIKVNNITNTDMGEMFGFTPAEVERLCSDYGHPERFDEAKDWYDGCRFGNTEIYNPWSILNYVDSGFRPNTYWAGTSGNSIIDTFISGTDPGTYGALRSLGEGDSISSRMDAEVTFTEISGGSEKMYSIMAVSGYLRVVSDGRYGTFSIPNREMFDVFASKIVERSGDTGFGNRLYRLSEAILSNDIEGIVEPLGSLAEDLGSRVFNDEHSYQAFVSGLLMHLHGRYALTAEIESGRGFHDIMLRRKKGAGPNIVIELKRRRRGDPDPQRLAESALDQIRDRDYAHGLEGTTVLHGIAFDGKKPYVASEIAEL